jgi:hypothetical protein
MKVELEKRILPSAKEVIIVHNRLKLVDVLIFWGVAICQTFLFRPQNPKKKSLIHQQAPTVNGIAAQVNFHVSTLLGNHNPITTSGSNANLLCSSKRKSNRFCSGL